MSYGCNCSVAFFFSQTPAFPHETPPTPSSPAAAPLTSASPRPARDSRRAQAARIQSPGIWKNI